MNSFLQHLHHVSPLHALLLLAIGMLLESTAIPVPSEVVLPVAGIWIAQGKFGGEPWGFIEAMLVVTAGSLAGSAISYLIGRHGGKPLLEQYGRYVLISRERLRSGEDWIKRHGAWSIAVGRLVFGVRHVQSLVAGTLRMDFIRFMVSTLIGCTLWNTLGVYLGFRYGKAIEHLLRTAGLGMFGVLVIAMIVVIVRFRQSQA